MPIDGERNNQLYQTSHSKVAHLVLLQEMPKKMHLKMFSDDEICDHLAYHTNLYSTQQTGKSIETTRQEIETLFGTQITMTIVKMSQYKMYWSKEFKYDPIASTMTLKRYKTLQRFLHASDKFFKVRPLLDLVRNNCIKIEPEQHHSIDEQIILAKTK